MQRIVAYDLETHLIQPGLLTPPIVCGATAEWRDGRIISARLLTRDEALVEIRKLLLDDDILITTANGVFDMAVVANEDPSLLPLIFRAYKLGRIWCVLIAASLDAIYHGHLFKEPNGMPLLSAKGKQTDRYSLDICVRHCLGRADAKDRDFWRKRYAILESLPHSEWPEEAKLYPLDDVGNTAEVTAYQLGLHPSCPLDAVTGKPRVFKNLQDMPAQCETDWCMHLGAIWGLRTDESRLDILTARAEELHKEYIARFTDTGFFRKPRERYLTSEALAAGKVDPEAGKRDTAAVARAVARAYGATGVCDKCSGAQFVMSYKTVECRGSKHKNRMQGCLGPACTVCSGVGTVQKPTNSIQCDKCSASGFGDVSMVPTTDGGGLSTSRDTLTESGDEDLMHLGENQQEKVRRTYEPYLRRGVRYPITLEPHVLVESGRTSFGGPIQLFPRGALGVTAKGVWVPTLRECIMARGGRVLSSSDYPGGELCAIGQVCLWVVGYSKMADAINEKGKPGSLHAMFAARMTGDSIESFTARMKAGDKAAKDFRQAAKPVNFGLGGGMGAAKLVLTNRKEGAGTTYAPNGRKYDGIRFCILVGGAQACGVEKVSKWGRAKYEREIPPTCRQCLELVEHQIKPLWFETFPEVKDLHRWVQKEMEHSGAIPAFGPWFNARGTPHRIRAVESFASAANSTFQSFIADVTKDALRRVARESYDDPSSVLYRGQFRPIVMQHDEILGEGALESAHLWGPRVGEIMHQTYNDWIPDVRIEGVGTALQTHWNKNAEEVYDSDGKLLVWEPEEKKS